MSSKRSSGPNTPASPARWYSSRVRSRRRSSENREAEGSFPAADSTDVRDVAELITASYRITLTPRILVRFIVDVPSTCRQRKTPPHRRDAAEWVEPVVGRSRAVSQAPPSSGSASFGSRLSRIRHIIIRTGELLRPVCDDIESLSSGFRFVRIASGEVPVFLRICRRDVDQSSTTCVSNTFLH